MSDRFNLGGKTALIRDAGSGLDASRPLREAGVKALLAGRRTAPAGALLMVAIAGRDLERTDAEDPAIDQLIKEFYQRIDRADVEHASEMSLNTFHRERAISPQYRRDLHPSLLSITRSKLAVSNHKFARVDRNGK